MYFFPIFFFLKKTYFYFEFIFIIPPYKPVQYKNDLKINVNKKEKIS